MKYLLNNYGLIFILIFSVIFFAYCGIITFNNIKYYNEYVKGIIAQKSDEITEDPDAGSGNYTFIKYKIISNKNVYFSKSTEEFDLHDSVFCAVNNNNSVKILSVNNVKISSRYGFQDIISLIICMIPIFYLIFKMKKK